MVKSKNTRGIQNECYSKKSKKKANVENPAINLFAKAELSLGVFEFSNTSDRFENARIWVLELVAKNDKKYLFISYSVHDTTISITPGFCF